jgi:nitrate/nitrite transporter NarK
MLTDKYGPRLVHSCLLVVGSIPCFMVMVQFCLLMSGG